MTWMLTASGQAPAASDVRGWLELEHKLVAELQAVLSKPEYGAVSSWFRGVHAFSSDVHRTPAAPIPVAAADALQAPETAPKGAPARRGKSDAAPPAAAAPGA